jgi:hypothetical protein
MSRLTFLAGNDR